MIVTVTRHGARTPNNDAVKLDWTSNLGKSELTDFGRFQQYLLGQTLRHEYPQLFDKPLTSQEYFLRSSKKPRTIDSALYFFKGINNYPHALEHLKLDEESLSHIRPPFRTDKVFSTLQYLLPEYKFAQIGEPVILTKPDQSGDPLLKNHKEDVCPAGKAKAKESIKPAIDSAIEKSKEVLDSVASLIKKKLNIENNVDFKFMKSLGDVATSDYFHRKDSAVLSVKEPLGNYIVNINAINHLSAYRDRNFIKVAISNLLKDILMHIKQKTDPTSPSSKKLVAYSAHDTNLSPLLSFLNLTDFDCNLRQLSSEQNLGCALKPPYSSNLLFEVDKDSRGKYWIATRYNGEYIDLCHKTLQGKKVCPLEEFVKKMKEGVYENEDEMKQFCKAEDVLKEKVSVKEDAPKRYVELYVIVVAVAIIIVGVMTLRYKRSAENKKRLIDARQKQK